MTAHRLSARHGLALVALLIASAAGAQETVVSLSPEAKEKILDEAAAGNASAIGEPTINGLRRGIHGEVGMMIGTNGARGLYTSMDAPIGETGWVSLDAASTRYGRR